MGCVETKCKVIQAWIVIDTEDFWLALHLPRLVIPRGMHSTTFDVLVVAHLPLDDVCGFVLVLRKRAERRLVDADEFTVT